MGSFAVTALAMVGTVSSEEADDLSINPVPVASGELTSPIIGHTVSRCPASPALEAVRP